MGKLSMHDSTNSLAVIGMSGRFPKARNLKQFWQNLRNGVEAITFPTDQEIAESGADSAEFDHPNFVKCSGGVLDDVELFDASFFDYTPREAEAMDPQQRLFLEDAWTALENAGYDPQKYPGSIGVYAGISMNSYVNANLLANLDFMRSLDNFNLMVSNDKDFVATRVSYKLNLSGPSIVIQTACSTSLVAICQACQALLNYQCDMALSGGVSIGVPQKYGYIYQQGGIASPDGHCRAFDAKAQGTVGGNGLGVVVLKRLADALEDGDYIHAVVRGFGLNNDGSVKVGFTAPSVDGQAEAIAMAHAFAGIQADTVSYVEAHGTGTELGDPIEISGLTKAFRASTEKSGFCAIGSVKTNIGHLDAAAGVAGFIKTVLALQHKELPPSLHFESPNPKIDFENSPFYVNAKLAKWKKGKAPRRAGVSSFGIGGTNAHVVVEEAPATEKIPDSHSAQLLLLSAKSQAALDTMSDNLVGHLGKNPGLDLADVAFTLQIGRQAFRHRRMLVCDSVADAVETLRRRNSKRVIGATHEPGNRAVAFMFPGQGAQFVDMGKELYDTEPRFREVVDRCRELLLPHLKFDLRDVLYPGEDECEQAASKLKQTATTQPALFIVEYALASLWLSWGIRPQAMIGHSIGEYVAACLANVFSLEDALALVAARGAMMQQLEPGAMLVLSLSEREIEPFLNERLALAASNAPSLCVVSGPQSEIEDLQKRLAAKGLEGQRLHTSHAFHSGMMDPILQPFTELVQRIELSAPQIPYISNVTGTWVTAEQATDPSYWARHLRQTVKFAAGIRELLQEPSRVLLEAGPGTSLGTLAGINLQAMKQEKESSISDQLVVSSMRRPDGRQPDRPVLLTALGQLWLAGVEVDWHRLYEGEKRRRQPLPTYPFERQRYWVDPQPDLARAPVRKTVVSGKNPDLADWFYLPVWKQSVALSAAETNGLAKEKSPWLLFLNDDSFGQSLLQRLEREQQPVVAVRSGETFERLDDSSYRINPRRRADYDALVTDLEASAGMPATTVHLWETEDSDDGRCDGFYSLLFLAQAFAQQNVTRSLEVIVVSNQVQEVTGEEALSPARATLLGPCRVIPQEYLNITCRSVDLVLPATGSANESRLLEQLVQEILAQSPDRTVAYRGNRRWVQDFEPVRLAEREGPPAPLRSGGVYLITGGLGRIGLVLAEYLAETVQAKLVLTGRSQLPPREQWGAWLKDHDDTDDASVKIRRVQALEKMGAEVLVASADVSNVDQMQAVVDRTVEQFGGVDGVIHAAGVIVGNAVGNIGDTSESDCRSQFQAKIDGLAVLEKVLQGRKLDFCFLLSSLSSVLGGFGFVAYSAANLFMDSFARKQNLKQGVPWISANWDAWDFSTGKRLKAAVGSSLTELALSPEEGKEAFARLLASNLTGQVVVSTGDLQARIDQWIQLEDAERPEEAPQADVSALHARPDDLQGDYVAPSNELEESLAEIWQELFGIKQIGVHDNFFELGGHSLLATRLISRVRDAFQVELTLHTFFEKPTIAELADEILEKLVEQEDSETLDQILAEIEADA